ncbi:MAG: UDP-2,4-diacetamido-2,4,6-trideoxy-beta-L-altropyranose hydrolase [Alphaproteobacteria bacterium]
MFRANGGPGVGNGHIIRCLALAQGLSSLGWSTMLAASEVTFSTMPQASEFDRMIHLDANMDEVKRLAGVIEGKADLLVIDDYAQDIQFEESCRIWARKILVIDDLANRHHDADYIVDPGTQSVTSYDSLVPRHCQRLLGPKWVLLRPEFSVERRTVLGRRQLVAPVRRILIAIGGADGRNLTPSLISAATAATAGLNVSLDVILGGYASSLAAVREMQQQEPASFDLHVDTDKVASLMSSADVAIGACGVGSWERCAMGLPTIGIITAENQKPLASVLYEAGAIDLIGESAEATEAGIEAAITSLLNNPHVRQTMSAAASELCDGGGIYRLSAVLDGTKIRQDLHDW